MERETITAIIYNKESGEYTIKTRDANGKPNTWTGNSPTAAGLAFINSAKHNFEDRWTAQWVN